MSGTALFYIELGTTLAAVALFYGFIFYKMSQDPPASE